MGFRLPHDYGKWVKAMGVGEDWASADISDFGIDGKYRFVGPIDHLADRLIDGDVEKFLARSDVEIIALLSEDGEDEFVGDLEDYEDYDEEDEFDDEQDGEYDEQGEDTMSAIARNMYNTTLEWCFANGEKPHPYLMDAAFLILAAIVRLPRLKSDADADNLLIPSRKTSLCRPRRTVAMNWAKPCGRSRVWPKPSRAEMPSLTPSGSNSPTTKRTRTTRPTTTRETENSN